MTSEVMAIMTSGPQMTAMKNIVLGIVFLGFTAYSSLVIFEHGYFGFITLALREPWAMQMLLDLCIALFFFGAWIRRDARERTVPALPYLLLLPVLGSVAALAYLMHRGLKAPKAPKPGELGSTLAVSR